MQSLIKKALIGLFGASIMVGGLAACSGGPHHQRHGAMTPERIAEVRAKLVERVGSKLDLDPAQKLKLNAFADALEAQRRALLGQAADPRAEMQAIVAGDKFDRGRAQALLTEKTQALQSQSPAVVAALADFYDSLNPTQQQQVRDLMQRRRGWMARG
jgi:protein CpxP